MAPAAFNKASTDKYYKAQPKSTLSS